MCPLFFVWKVVNNGWKKFWLFGEIYEIFKWIIDNWLISNKKKWNYFDLYEVVI